MKKIIKVAVLSGRAAPRFTWAPGLDKVFEEGGLRVEHFKRIGCTQPHH